MHVPVLLQETLAGLAPKEGETVIDATVGGAGHAKALALRIGKRGTLVGIDEDEAAIARGKEALKGFKGKLRLSKGNFRDLSRILRRLKVPQADRILMDLGVSSFQLDRGGRGFSFRHDEPLRMTFGRRPRGPFDATTMVNEWDEENLAAVIRGYGEERFARRIAKAIVEARKKGTIATSGALAAIVERAVGRRGRRHPATKTFQAIRIAVNDELRALEAALPQALEALRPGGRLAVISFHSLEDRIVKQFFKRAAAEGKISLVATKPVAPSEEEAKENPRARSAKLRIMEKR
ncbi:MAG: 16S rRNA (cytosine(1402)-N(4))-methyltransferase RsmH [bacterium]|nr:16S rRNA (cytosine(1402)-N(4))-methyltransferase RsmH [bacterium]